MPRIDTTLSKSCRCLTQKPGMAQPVSIQSSIMLQNRPDGWLWRLASRLKFAGTSRAGAKPLESRYTVLVDDNFHYMDESERYTHGTFASPEAAIAACKQIMDEFLEESCAFEMTRKGNWPSSEALYEHYVAYGPDPFIVTDTPSLPKTPFSAWAHAREQCFGRFAKPADPKSE